MLFSLLTVFSGCDQLKDLVDEFGDEEKAEMCIDYCGKVKSCDDGTLGNVGGYEIDSDGCKGLCEGVRYAGVDAVKLAGDNLGIELNVSLWECAGYSTCEEYYACIDAGGKSAYETKLAEDANKPEPEPAGSGSDDADSILADENVDEAVENSGFVVNEGSDPPVITGKYHAVGEIIAEQDGRSVGTAINTHVCLVNQSGTKIDWKEPGSDEASGTLTGEGDKWTFFLESSIAVYMMSGTKDGDNLKDVEILLTYKANLQNPGSDKWEQTLTQWTKESDTCD